MPMVNGKKFPYTAKGKKMAKAAKKKHEKTEGKKELLMEYGVKVRPTSKAKKK